MQVLLDFHKHECMHIKKQTCTAYSCEQQFCIESALSVWWLLAILPINLVEAPLAVRAGKKLAGHFFVVDAVVISNLCHV